MLPHGFCAYLFLQGSWQLNEAAVGLPHKGVQKLSVNPW